MLISHSSAMELHRMVTQPQFTVLMSIPKRLRARTIHGTEFRFVFVPAEHLFGVAILRRVPEILHWSAG
jgi:predicted transcriptional regulator of viral defense system